MAELEYFLKNTIVGILMLGAAGSIVAVGFLKGLGILGERARPAWSQFFRRRKRSIISYYETMTDNDRSRQTAFFAFHLSRALTFLGMFAVLSLSAALMLASSQPLIFGQPLYLYLLYVSSLVAGYWAYKHLFVITTVYRHFCQSRLDDQQLQKAR